MPTFYRGLFTELWITLSSNEILGVLDSDYLEDYFGVDGQITVRHQNGTPYTVLMNELIDETPGIAHDVFAGFLDLSSVPDGEYTIQGRVRDVVGNYTILNAVETPVGGERIIDLVFTISSEVFGTSLIVYIGPVKLLGGISLTSNFGQDQELSIPWHAPDLTLDLMGEVEVDASPTSVELDEIFLQAPTLDIQVVKAVELEASLLGE